MSTGQTAEKIAESVWLKLTSRGLMALTGLLLPVISWFGYNYVMEIRADIASIEAKVEPLPEIKSRMNNAETAISGMKVTTENNDRRIISLEEREMYGGKRDDATNERVDKLQEALTELAKSQSALTATVNIIMGDRQRVPQ